MYVHDLATEHDDAIDRREITGEASDFNQPDGNEAPHITDIHEDDVHEKPSPMFHNTGLYDEAEGYDEATGEKYTGHKTEEELAEDTFGYAGHLLTEHVVDEAAGDATDQWLSMVEAQSGKDAQNIATQQWLEAQKKQL